MRPREEDLRLELDPSATTGIFEQTVNSIFEVDETGNGTNKRTGAYLENEFGNAKRAKTDNERAGTNDVEGEGEVPISKRILVLPQKLLKMSHLKFNL